MTGELHVNLGRLLDATELHLRRYVVLTDDQACAVTLWTAHTWAIDFAYCTPYLDIHSPEKRSGKTRLLEVLDTIVAKPWLTGGTSKAALVRKVDHAKPTLLLDESDTAFGGDKEYAEALRGVLNNGYTRGKPYTTCIGQSTAIRTKDFDVFGPKAIAGIGRLPDTVADRSIPIALNRRAPGERVERFRRRRAEEEGGELANGFFQLRETNGFVPLDEAEPQLPDELDDRAQDVWEPLLAIADLADGEWPNRARDAAKRLSDSVGQESDSYGIRLLADCRTVFDGHDALSTSELIERLYALEEAPWGEWQIRPKRLADLLRPYGIRSCGIRVGDRTPRGYRREDFEGEWRRYLPDLPSQNATSATTALTSQEPGVLETQHDPNVADSKGAENPHSNADVADVAFRSPDTRQEAVNGGPTEEVLDYRNGPQRLPSADELEAKAREMGVALDDDEDGGP